jgi:hypothetical protein
LGCTRIAATDKAQGMQSNYAYNNHIVTFQHNCKFSFTYPGSWNCRTTVKWKKETRKGDQIHETHQGAIEGCREHELAVVGELGKGHGRALVIYKGLNAVAGGGVPDAAETVVAPRHDHGSLAIEVDGGDGLGVGRQHAEAPSGPHLPHTHRLVEGSRGEHVAVGAEGDTEGVVGVAGERLDQAGSAAGAEVPDADGAVVGSGGEEAAVGGEGEVGYALSVASNLGDGGEIGGGPNAEELVGGGGGEEAAIRGELDRGYGAAMAGESPAEDVAGGGRSAVGCRRRHCRRSKKGFGLDCLRGFARSGWCHSVSVNGGVTS